MEEVKVIIALRLKTRSKKILREFHRKIKVIMAREILLHREHMGRVKMMMMVFWEKRMLKI